jgi:hypothetical protein
VLKGWRGVLMLGAVALTATACGRGSAGTSASRPDSSVNTFAGSEHVFPDIRTWQAGMDETSGTDYDPRGLARVVFDGQPSDLRGVLVLVKPESAWTPDSVKWATAYLSAAARLGTGQQGAVWVSRRVGLVAGGQESVNARTTFGSARLTFVSEDIGNQPGVTMDVSFDGP